MQQQHGVPVQHLPLQAELARTQSAEQKLHLQITSLNVELKQKDVQLTELRKAKVQMEEQVAAGKAQADKASAELKDKTAQLSKVQASLIAQQAEVKPVGDFTPAPTPVPNPQVLLCLYLEPAETRFSQLLACVAYACIN